MLWISVSLHHWTKSLWHACHWSLSTSNAIKHLWHLFKICFPRFTAKRANAFRIFGRAADSHQQWSQQQPAGVNTAPYTDNYIWSPKVSMMWLLILASLHILRTKTWQQLLRWHWEQTALMLRQHGVASEFKQLSSITITLTSSVHNAWARLGCQVPRMPSGSLLYLLLLYI